MKKIMLILAGMLAGFAGFAQNNDALKAVADAAMEITEAQTETPKEKKPNYWSESLKTNIKSVRPPLPTGRPVVTIP